MKNLLISIFILLSSFSCADQGAIHDFGTLMCPPVPAMQSKDAEVIQNSKFDDCDVLGEVRFALIDEANLVNDHSFLSNEEKKSQKTDLINVVNEMDSSMISCSEIWQDQEEYELNQKLSQLAGLLDSIEKTL